MAKVTTLFPDKDGDRTPVQLTRLSNTERTAAQVQVLLNIAANCADVCAIALESGDQFDPSDEVVEAASETYVQAQIQLRNIIDDMSRWGTVDEQDTLAEDLVKGNALLLKKQQAAVDSTQAPHRRLNCQLRLFQAGWIAWVGADTPSPEVLHGIGKSPKEALENFDRNFEAATDNTPDTLTTSAPVKKNPKK